MEILQGKKKLTSHNVEYPVSWLENKDIKVCAGDLFTDGCNVFPADKVAPLFLDTALDSNMLPELSLNSVNTGEPTPGATIQPLPEPKYADNLPDVNCEKCKAPADWLEPNRLAPIPVPQ
jgi:ribose transport system substrate-binding protein